MPLDNMSRSLPEALYHHHHSVGTPNGSVYCDPVGGFRPTKTPDMVFRSYGEWFEHMKNHTKEKPIAEASSDRLWPFGENVMSIQGSHKNSDFYVIDGKRRLDRAIP